ncbi:MAG TPA: hypothetical protein VG733_11775 [Chthoniobacteraceae bacterium]|nr:hypothetical protein [Chthoniobacteraceae bacterium]
MNETGTNREILDREHAAYRKVYRAVFCFYYISVGLLFVFLCKQGIACLYSPSWFGFLKAAGAIAGIWYLFYLCDTEGGVLKLLRQWEKSLMQRMRQEEAIEALRAGGLYFIDDMEMTLVDDKYLVPRDRVK